MHDEILKKYFHRMEVWDYLTAEIIHVFDHRQPRVITMDYWPQRIYLDATGRSTVGEYIRHIARSYPYGNAPPQLQEIIIGELIKLVDVEYLIQLSDVPVELHPSVRDPMTPIKEKVEMRGTWSGHYIHDHHEIPAVDFTITIDRTSGPLFSGTVEDDNSGGGTPGVGAIEGRIIDRDHIRFIKSMPIHTTVDQYGIRVIDTSEKHPAIHYAGELAPGKERVTGTWQFRSEVAWKGWFPYRQRSGSGTFTMWLLKENDG